jgi:hypothetical protein
MSCKCERLALRRLTLHRLSKGLSSAGEGQNGIQHQDSINRFTSPPYTGRHTSLKPLILSFFFCACLSFIYGRQEPAALSLIQALEPSEHRVSLITLSQILLTISALNSPTTLRFSVHLHSYTRQYEA